MVDLLQISWVLCGGGGWYVKEVAEALDFFGGEGGGGLWCWW
jgi:hypothetical protein